MKTLSQKLMYPTDRREYTEAFLEEYSKDPWKSKLIEDFGVDYYNEVIRIHQERLDKNNFNIGPQSIKEWDELKNSFSK